jgi:hypothetical protein
MYDPRNKHGTVKCVPRFINGNRAGPLIHAPTRSRAPTKELLHDGKSGFLPETGEVCAGGKDEQGRMSNENRIA